MNSNRETLLRTLRIQLQRLLQRLFQLSHGHKPFKLPPDDSFPVNDKSPRLGNEAPLFYSRKNLFAGKVLPDFLMDKGNSLVVSGKQLPNDIDYRTAHSTGAELRGGEDDELRLPLSDGLRDPYLV